MSHCDPKNHPKKWFFSCHFLGHPDLHAPLVYLEASMILVLYTSFDYIKMFNRIHFNLVRGCEFFFPPYLFGDKGYPFPPWIITPHKKRQQHFMLEFLHNRKHKHECVVCKKPLVFWNKAFKRFCTKLTLISPWF